MINTFLILFSILFAQAIFADYVTVPLSHNKESELNKYNLRMVYRKSSVRFGEECDVQNKDSTVVYIQGGPGLPIPEDKSLSNTVAKMMAYMYQGKCYKQVLTFAPRGTGEFFLDLNTNFSFLNYDDFLVPSVSKDIKIMIDDFFSKNKDYNKRITLVAHSHGVHQAFHFASKYPSLVKNIIVFNGSSKPSFFALDLKDGQIENTATSLTGTIVEGPSQGRLDDFIIHDNILRNSGTGMSYFLNDIHMCTSYLHNDYLKTIALENNNSIQAYKAKFCNSNKLNQYFKPERVDLRKIEATVLLVNSDFNSVYQSLMDEDFKELKKRNKLTYYLRITHPAPETRRSTPTHSWMPLSQSVFSRILQEVLEGNTNLESINFSSPRPGKLDCYADDVGFIIRKSDHREYNCEKANYKVKKNKYLETSWELYQNDEMISQGPSPSLKIEKN